MSALHNRTGRMGGTLDLSIIIVNWNTSRMLQDCLASVFAGLDGRSAEVIVVDNASDDGSADMVRSDFPRVRLIENSENRGFAAANNQALEVASGKYLLLLNSDTLIHGVVLPASVAYMDAHTDVGVMGCRVLNGDGTLQPTCSQYPSLINLTLLTSGLWKLPWPGFLDRYQMRRWDRTDEREVDIVSGCYMMVRRAALDEVGPLDERFFFYGEETDWCRRFRAAGWKLRFAPVGEITHFGGGSVRRLDHVRDLMLTSATVMLHRKHGGMVSAISAWIILFAFNLSRAVFWSIAALFCRNDRTRRRRNHFLGLVRQIRKSWPAAKTASF